MVKQQWGVQRMSHHTPTRTILACVQDREGEKADRERLKERGAAELMPPCRPGHSVCLKSSSVTSCSVTPAFRCLRGVFHSSRCTRQHNARAHRHWLLSACCRMRGFCPEPPNKTLYSMTRSCQSDVDCNCCWYHIRGSGLLPKCTAYQHILSYFMNICRFCRIRWTFGPRVIYSRYFRELQVACAEAHASSPWPTCYCSLCSSGLYHIHR